MRKSLEVNPLEGGILKGMLVFALPISVSALLTMLFSCADTVVIGRFGHENAISAIGVSASVLNFLVSGLSSLAAGVTVVAGKLYGQNEPDKVRRLLHSLPLTSLCLGAGLSLLAILFSGGILRLLNCPDAILEDALAYFRIYFLGVPLTVMTGFLSAIMFYMCLFFGLCGTMNVITGCELGLGDAKTPLVISILCSVCFRLTWVFTYAAWKGTVEAVYLSYPICWGLCTLLNALAFHKLFNRKKSEFLR